MTRSSLPLLRCVVEGLIDQEVARVLAREAGFLQTEFVGTLNGRGNVLKNIGNYNRSANQIPWLVLVDLDKEKCAPNLMKKYLPHPAKKMCFRVAVHEMEAWLLADRERFASFFKLPSDSIPDKPDLLKDPKQEVISLLASSTDRIIKKLMLPRSGSGRTVGPGYSDKLIEFLVEPSHSWRIREAIKHSPSLNRCFYALQKLRKQA